MIYLGSFGLFFTCFTLFIRWVPAIAIAEVKGVLPAADPHFDEEHGDEHEHAHDAKESEKDSKKEDSKHAEKGAEA